MFITALRSGRDRYSLHPVVSVVTGTDHITATALLGRLPGTSIVTALDLAATGRTAPTRATAAVAGGPEPLDAGLAELEARLAEVGERIAALEAGASVALADPTPIATALMDLLAARARSAGRRRPSLAQAELRVEHARMHLLHVVDVSGRRARATVHGPNLRELHRLIQNLVQKAGSGLGRRSFQRRVAQLRDDERTLLGKMGLGSYAEYEMLMSDPDSSPGALDRARQALLDAEADLASIRSGSQDEAARFADRAEAWLESTLSIAGPVPHLDPDAAAPATDDPAGSGRDAADRAQAWLDQLSQAEARRRDLDVERLALQAEARRIDAELSEGRAIAGATRRLRGTPLGAAPADAAAPARGELDVVAALAAHRGDAPFVLDGALDEADADAVRAVLDLLASRAGRPQVLVLTGSETVSAWGATAHPGRAATIDLAGRVVTGVEQGETIDLVALTAEHAPHEVGTPAPRTGPPGDAAAERGHTGDVLTRRATGTEVELVGRTPPARKELTPEEVDAFGLDLFHLAAAEDAPAARKRRWGR